NAFRSSLSNAQYKVAEWLGTVEPAYKLIWKYGRWSFIIADDILSQLGLLDSNYPLVLRNLLIRTVCEKTYEFCMICLEPHESIIRLPCGHYYCLEFLLHYYELTLTKQCVYCKRSYQFADCINCSIKHRVEKWKK